MMCRLLVRVWLVGVGILSCGVVVGGGGVLGKLLV